LRTEVALGHIFDNGILYQESKLIKLSH